MSVTGSRGSVGEGEGELVLGTTLWLLLLLLLQTPLDTKRGGEEVVCRDGMGWEGRMGWTDTQASPQPAR